MMRVIQADITTLAVDAIVNAANASLLGGGGVDGAIHRAAGPELRTECLGLGGCPTGEARKTEAYRLPARMILHTVGPVWQGGEAGESEQLAACYRSCLTLAHRHGVRSIAFPSISTGAFGFPIERAAQVAVETVGRWLEAEGAIEVLFCCFSAADAAVYTQALAVWSTQSAGVQPPAPH